MGEPPGDDDATLVRRIAENRDDRAFAELMERHAPKVTGDLRHRFRYQMQESDIDAAVNWAASLLWRNAHRFDGTRLFGPWFRTIAHRSALKILEGEKRNPTITLEFDPYDPMSDQPDDDCGDSPRTTWYMDQLEQVIDHELKGFEQVVAQADVAAGGPGAADNMLLMKQHNKKKGVVHSTRSKVWKKIKQTIRDREVLLHRTGVNP